MNTIYTTLALVKIDSWRLVLLLATAVSLIGYPKPASAATFNVTVGLCHYPCGYFPFVFGPSSVTIHPGDQVMWTWASNGHSTTSGRPGMPDGIWNSGVRNYGATFTHTFNSVGTFPYYCTQGAEVGQVIVISATPTPTPTPTPVARAQVADFNGDGHPDFVVQNPGTHQTAIVYLHNNVVISAAFGPTLPALWRLRGVADFNIDSHPDYGLFNSNTGQTAIAYLSGPTVIDAALGPTLPAGWELVATADFNGDGYPDYVLYIASTGQTVIAYLNNTVVVGGAFGPSLPAGWALVATADFNGDGHPDYLLYNAETRQTEIWYLNNNVFVSAAFGPTLPAGWSLVGE